MRFAAGLLLLQLAPQETRIESFAVQNPQGANGLADLAHAQSQAPRVRGL